MTPKKLVNAEHDLDLGSSVIIPLQYIYIYIYICTPFVPHGLNK